MAESNRCNRPGERAEGRGVMRGLVQTLAWAVLALSTSMVPFVSVADERTAVRRSGRKLRPGRFRRHNAGSARRGCAGSTSAAARARTPGCPAPCTPRRRAPKRIRNSPARLCRTRIPAAFYAGPSARPAGTPPRAPASRGSRSFPPPARPLRALRPGAPMIQPGTRPAVTRSGRPPGCCLRGAQVRHRGYPARLSVPVGLRALPCARGSCGSSTTPPKPARSGSIRRRQRPGV